MLVKQINSEATRNIEKKVATDKIIVIISFGNRCISKISNAKNVIEKKSEVENNEL